MPQEGVHGAQENSRLDERTPLPVGHQPIRKHRVSWSAFGGSGAQKLDWTQNASWSAELRTLVDQLRTLVDQLDSEPSLIS